jgi:opacity protein-like surface antigen
MILTLVAVSGLAVLASAALAHAHEYNAKSSPITASGANHTFTAGEAIIKCAKAKFEYSGGTGKFSTITVVPTYKECFVKEKEAIVTVEKAKFEFGAPKEVKSGEFSLPDSIVGEAGAQIKVTVTIEGQGCEVVFPAQAIAGEATKFVNNGGKTGGEVKAKLEGLEYKSNSKCAGIVGKEGTNGKYEGGASQTGLIVE